MSTRLLVRSLVGMVVVGASLVNSAGVYASTTEDIVADSAAKVAAPLVDQVVGSSQNPNLFTLAKPTVAPASPTATSLFSLLPQLERLKALLSSASVASTKSIATKSYTDRVLGVTLRYPTKPVVYPSVATGMESMEQYFKVYELAPKGGDDALVFALVSNDMGELYWSFFAQGMSQGLHDGLLRQATSSNKDATLAMLKSVLKFENKTVTHRGYTLRHEYWSFNGRPVLGMYSGVRTVPEGTFLAAVSLYTSLPLGAADRATIPTEQEAKDIVATILEKSTVDAKKVKKFFD